MPVFKIHHITKYEYDRPVSESVNEMKKIFPVATDEQEILSHEIIISPTPDMHSFMITGAIKRVYLIYCRYTLPWSLKVSCSFEQQHLPSCVLTFIQVLSSWKRKDPAI